MQKTKPTFIAIAILISLTSLNCSQPVDCSKVKNGKFFYYAKLDRRKVLVERFDSLQIEVDQKKNEVLRSKIIWQNDCKFIMFVNQLSQTKLNNEDSLLSTNPATIEIINVTRYFYICISKITISQKDYEIKDTMYFQNSN